MHGSIRDELIRDGWDKSSEELHNHLSSCRECSTELNTMRTHSALLRDLRAPEEAEPTAGFYARVMQRIEERARQSIWAVFVYSPFAKRLTYASFALALLLGSYVVAEESRDGHLTAPSTMVAQGTHYDPPVEGSIAQQRDAVLENFAFERGSIR
jgi:hypothetical protein